MDDDQLKNILYRHAVAAKDIGAADADAIVRLLNAKDGELLARLSERYSLIEADGFDKSPVTTKRYEELRKILAELNSKVYKNVAAGLTDRLEAVAGHEADFAAKAMASVNLGTTAPDANFLKTLVQNTPLPFADDGHTRLMPWLNVQEAGRLRRLEGALTQGIAEGMSTGQLVAVIRGTKATGFTDGILQTSRKDATTIALTANSAVQNAARLETFKRNPKITHVEWSAILDGRTSQICQGRSGTLYLIDQPHPKPPAHPRCRSLLLPRRDTEGTKHEPYGDWLRKQPDAVQNEVLGKARADIFRANPDFDFGGFFKESGSYRTLGELREFDARLFEGGVKSPAKAPTKPKEALKSDPVPEASKRLEMARNPNVTDATIKPMPRKDALKVLSAKTAQNAKDVRYDPRPEFRSMKAEAFGKASLSTEFSDAASGALVEIWPELDAMADAFNIPRLRATKPISGKGAVATMGDGSLQLNAPYFNGYASKIGLTEAGEESAALSKLKAEQATMRVKLLEMSGKLGEYNDQLAKLGTGIEARAERFALAAEQRILYLEWRKLSGKEFKLRQKINTVARPSSHTVSKWKPGDDVKQRPHTVDYYFDGVDRMRTVLYHEFAHHLHQMKGKTGRRAVVGTPPIERKLKAMFFNKFHGAAPGNLGRGSERKALVTSTYATTNEAEWFAESYAAFMMGRRDLADPDLVALIEELLNDAA